jgi:hypothetical protein
VRIVVEVINDEKRNSHGIGRGVCNLRGRRYYEACHRLPTASAGKRKAGAASANSAPVAGAL